MQQLWLHLRSTLVLSSFTHKLSTLAWTLLLESYLCTNEITKSLRKKKPEYTLAGESLDSFSHSSQWERVSKPLTSSFLLKTLLRDLFPYDVQTAVIVPSKLILIHLQILEIVTKLAWPLLATRGHWVAPATPEVCTEGRSGAIGNLRICRDVKLMGSGLSGCRNVFILFLQLKTGL